MNAAAVAVAIHLALPGVSDALATRYAADIAAVSTTREQALLLVTIARHESDFRPAVERCEVTGKVGEVTLYQLHPAWLDLRTRRRVCESNREAAKVAAGRVAQFWEKTGGPIGTLMRYAGRAKIDRRIRDRLVTYEMLNKEIPK
jgi:hypothetical protein